jgi:uncharacterized protein
MASKNSQQSLSLIKMAMCGQAWAFKAAHASLPADKTVCANHEQTHCLPEIKD